MVTIISAILAVMSYIFMNKNTKFVWLWFAIFVVSIIAASGSFVYYIWSSDLPDWVKILLLR